MDDSINLSVSSLPDDTISVAYKRAAKQFLNKKFDESYQTLEPLLTEHKPSHDRLWMKIWSLYLAICDKAVADTSIFPRKVRKQLTEKTVNGAIWDEVDRAYGGLDNANPDLLLSLVKLSAKHTQDLTSISQSIEKYLTSTMDNVEGLSQSELESYGDLVMSYALKVLPQIDEFEYAQEFIQINPFILDKTSAYAKLEEAKQQKRAKDQEQKAKLAEQERQEKLRVQQATEKLSASTNSPSISECEEDAIPSKDLSPIDPKPISTPPPQIPSPSRTSKREIVRPHDFSSLITYWRGYFSDLFKSASFLKVLLFIAVILLSVSNPIAKDRIKRALNAVWAKLAGTIRMGTKVSYV